MVNPMAMGLRLAGHCGVRRPRRCTQLTVRGKDALPVRRVNGYSRVSTVGATHTGWATGRALARQAWPVIGARDEGRQCPWMGGFFLVLFFRSGSAPHAPQNKKKKNGGSPPQKKNLGRCGGAATGRELANMVRRPKHRIDLAAFVPTVPHAGPRMPVRLFNDDMSANYR